jgi:hypothetical protein
MKKKKKIFSKKYRKISYIWAKRGWEIGQTKGVHEGYTPVVTCANPDSSKLKGVE